MPLLNISYTCSFLRKQAGFHHGKSTVDQITLQTQDIKDSFLAKNKAGAVCVDFAAT